MVEIRKPAIALSLSGEAISELNQLTMFWNLTVSNDRS